VYYSKIKISKKDNTKADSSIELIQIRKHRMNTGTGEKNEKANRLRKS
jgi:hypothetical protein